MIFIFGRLNAHNMESLNDFSEDLIVECMNRYINIWYIYRRPHLFPFALTDFAKSRENLEKLTKRFGFDFSEYAKEIRHEMHSVFWSNTIEGQIEAMKGSLGRRFKREVDNYPELYKRYLELSKIESKTEDQQKEYDNILEHHSAFQMENVSREEARKHIFPADYVIPYVETVKIINEVVTLNRSIYDIIPMLERSYGVHLAFIVNADYDKFRLLDDDEEKAVEEFGVIHHDQIMQFYQTGFKDVRLWPCEIEHAYKFLPHLVQRCFDSGVYKCTFRVNFRKEIEKRFTSDHARELYISKMYLDEIISEYKTLNKLEVERQGYLHFKKCVINGVDQYFKRAGKHLQEEQIVGAAHSIPLSIIIKYLRIYVPKNKMALLPLTKTLRDIDACSHSEIQQILSILNMKFTPEDAIRSKHPYLTHISDQFLSEIFKSA